MFYIQCLSHYAYDYILWWRPDSKGYTYNLNEAGLYTEEQAKSIVGCRGEEVAWRKTDVERCTDLAVNIHVLREHVTPFLGPKKTPKLKERKPQPESCRLCGRFFSMMNRCPELSEDQRVSLVTTFKLRMCHIKASEANKLRNAERRDRFKKQGLLEAETSEALRLIAALYWGEGNKTNGQFGLSNSDPSMLKLVISWLQKRNFKFRFCVYSHLENGLTEAQVLDWWEEQTGVRPTRWHLQKVSRASQLKNVGKLPYGTGRLDANIEVLLLTMGAIEYIKESWVCSSSG